MLEWLNTPNGGFLVAAAGMLAVLGIAAAALWGATEAIRRLRRRK